MLLIFLSLWQETTLQPFLTSLHWLPYAAITVTVAIAIQFGRSRLVFCSLLLASSMAALGRPEVFPLPMPYLLSFAAFWLLWRQDKGVLPINAGLTLVEVLIVIVTGIYLLPFLSATLEAPLSALQGPLHTLAPEISLVATPFEVVSLMILTLSGLVRVIVQPSNSNVAILLCFISLQLIHFYPSLFAHQVMILLASLMFLLAVIIDSFNMAYRDELTTIPSRRALMQYVQTLGRKYVVVMADVDHFKKFNDTYGHDVGDQVLKLVASKMRQVTGGGRAFRYGGEEFTIIFARKSPTQIKAHLEALREVIADYPIVIRGKDRPEHPPKKRKKKSEAENKTVHVTCSFGVAERTPDSQDFEDILKQADIALYSAKKAGRNCVKVAEQD